MLSINTNLSSLITQNSMNSATNKLNQAIERMTTGAKINHAKDNAANYSISTNMTTKINSYMVAEDNVAMGMDMITTASDTLSGIDDKLVRLRSLATQASNGTYGTQSLNAINAEANALVDEIARLYSTAEYNGIKLFSNSSAAVPSQAQVVARFAMRAAATGYTQEQIDAMTTLSEAYNAGAFVEGETYSISSVEELVKFRDMVNAGNSGAGSTFVLIKDLNLSGISDWTPIGDSAYGTVFFSGIFDGNGHVISNLIIDFSWGSARGLFGFVGSDTDPDSYTEIKNLGLEDVNIINGGSVVGALVGGVNSIGGTVNITNNYSTGTVSGNQHIGGLVGSIYGLGTINIFNNYSTATVTAEQFEAGGLIGGVECGGIINLENNFASGNVIADRIAGGLVGCMFFDGTASINNSFATGNVNGDYSVGGLVGDICFGGTGSINNSFATGNVNGNDLVGGLVGSIYSDGTLSLYNNYATGAVIGAFDFGGFIGDIDGSQTPTVTNCASVQADNYVVQKTANEILSPSNLESMGFTESNGWTIKNGLPVHNYQLAGSGGGTGGATGGGATGSLIGSNLISLQVGIGADSASQIGIDLGFSLGAVDDLRMIGLDTTTDFLTMIDEMIATVNAKEVEYGAVQNRLESALEEISTQYENLVSSRSTLRDADIAEESSSYIQAQILQQASATLMATANQSPSIALQLI